MARGTFRSFLSRSWILLASGVLAVACQATITDVPMGGGTAGTGGATTNAMTPGAGTGGGGGGAAGATSANAGAVGTGGKGASGTSGTGGNAPAQGTAGSAPSSSSADASVDAAEPPVIHEEVDATPPSADAIATTESVQHTLEGLAAQVDGARVVFADCTATPCTARVFATSLAGLRTLLLKISDAFHNRTSFVAREKFDGFGAHGYEADLVLDTDHPRPVPATEDELLTNPGT
jgi:hypothetical protein